MPVTKHTPGPWTHLGMGDIHGHEANGGGVDIAAVYLREDDEKWLANASLIAAAPELLSQLEFAVALLKPMFGHTAQVERMEDAIAKATGGAPCQ